MEKDLNSSVRHLEDALTPRHNFSIDLYPYEVRALENLEFLNEDTAYLFGDDVSLTSSVVRESDHSKSAIDNLYMEFFEIAQGLTNTQLILDTLGQMARCCSDALQTIATSMPEHKATKHMESVKWLKRERDTWRLLYVLLQDRLFSENAMEEDIPTQYFGRSEKRCAENLFRRENLIRECQLVIDWLEAQAIEKTDKILYFADLPSGWENTLHQLESADTIAFASSRPTVDKLDPDAPHYQEKPLHDIDLEDDKQLSKRMFHEIRCGKLDEAQKLARQSGHSWKAAILDGWQLFHNPNIKENISSSDPDDETEDMESNELQSIEGNSCRDIWKIMALNYAKQQSLNPYDKASIATFCGYLNGILPVCVTWEDHLWAYMKNMVDIRVESEIRDCCTKDNGYMALPDEYWRQKLSINEVFADLESSTKASVRTAAKEQEHVIQKYAILDETSNLLRDLQEWSLDPDVSPHFLRFIAHIALIMDQTGQAVKRLPIEKVLEVYIKHLMKLNMTALVAFYVSKLNSTSQVPLYALHLETIVDNSRRKEALEFAEKCGLNVYGVCKKIVEIVRSKPEEVDKTGNLQQKLTATDKLKISAIDWLTFYDVQWVDLLVESNEIIFKFLVLGKFDAAQLAFNKIPTDVIKRVTAELSEKNEEIDKVAKEHLSYKVYLEANETFNEWFKQAKNKPTPPSDLPETAQFSEKVVHQHRMSQHEAELKRWKVTTDHQTAIAKTMLFNVLLFPDGWLSGREDGAYLRKTVISSVTFLLCSLFCEMEMHKECLQLADVIAAESHCLYKEFSQKQMEDLMIKFAESSRALIESRKDAFGYELTA